MATVEQDNQFVFPDGLSISGKLVNPSNGYPLSSMNISVLVIIEKTDSRSSSRQRKKQILVAKDISDLYGHFSLLVKPINIFLQMSKQDKKISYLLRISNDNSKPLVMEYPIDFQSNNEDLTLNVPIGSSSISHRVWKDVATRMRQGRLIKINELVRELSGVTPKQMLFGHLSLETRQSIITELDKFFLDPNGVLNKISEISGFHKLRDYDNLKQYLISLSSKMQKPEVLNAVNRLVAKLNAFYDLFNVDWPLDLDELQSGRVGRALQKYEHKYRSQYQLEGETNK